MREIKFRAWDKTLNKIHCWTAIENHFTFEELLDTNFFEAMQYTGLKDKNGIEIYEGDLVEHDDNINDRWETYEACEVISSTEYCGFYFHMDEGNHLSNYRNLVVIGNKYENPELLK